MKTANDNISKKLKEDLRKIHRKVTEVGWKSEKGRDLIKEEVELKKKFASEYGEEALIRALFYKQQSPNFKLSNTKRNIY